MTTTKKTYTATLPTGETVSRQSARPFTHALLMRDADGWGIYSFSGSLAAVTKQGEKLTRDFARYQPEREVEFLVVEARES